MKREETLMIREISYTEPSAYNKEGYTVITTKRYVPGAEKDIALEWKFLGKRDDIKIGQSIYCTLSLVVDGDLGVDGQKDEGDKDAIRTKKD